MAFGRSKPDTDRRRDRRSSSMGRSALDWLVPIIESVPKRSFRDIGRFGFILSSSQAGRIGPWFSNTRPGIGHVNDDVGIPDIYYVHILGFMSRETAWRELCLLGDFNAFSCYDIMAMRHEGAVHPPSMCDGRCVYWEILMLFPVTIWWLSRNSKYQTLRNLG